MSLSGHHLLASPAPSSIGSVPHGSSPPSPAINGGFNCLCINNMSAAPGGEGRGGGASMQEGQDHFSLPTPPLLDSPPTSERITSLRLSEPVPETSNAIAPAQQCLTSAQSRPRPSQSGSSSRLDFSNPTLERFELFEPWDPRFSSKPPCDPPQPASTSPDMDGAGSDPEGAAGAKPKCKPRTIYINNPSRTCNSSSDICGNKVRTSKYTLLTFLPKNLFEQFRRVAYIYFLAIVILNQIPQLAVFGRTASLFPLLFVLVVTAIKDGYEDWGRHRSDIIENNRLAKVYIQGAFRFKKWKHIQVGEVVKVDANTPVPCDMVLLGTSNSSGVAYIQTLNLDGESNLKTRYANQETHMKQLDTNSPVSGVLDCEPPTRNIYEFSGVMRLENVEISLVPSNVILRGCEVKNTAWVVGVVVYAGKDTKVMMNSSGAQSKRSKLESQMNSATMWLAVFLLVICMIGGMGMGLWVARHENILDSLAYYHKLDLSTGENVEFYNAAGEAIFALLSFVIMFQVMIPISLYISMELVRLGQSTLMSRDTEMYHDDKGFECRALNINEDLGQIKYIFSDKTGTLTQNKMEFYTASVDGVDYNNAVAFCSLSEESSQSDDIQPWPIQPVKVDPKLLRLAQSSEKNSIENFFLVLAICNTVVPITVDREEFVKNVEASRVHLPHASAHLIDYQAESPDEQALVSAAAAYGYALLERTSRSVKVAIHGKPQRYELLGLHEFDSVRKRMSVVVRCPDQSIKLLLKGADAVVLDLLTKGLLDNAKYEVDTHQKHVLVSTHEHLDKYAKEGLRTLVIASKDLSQAEFQNWEKQYRSASKELGTVRVAWLRRVAETLEDNLTLLGATGIEDKLQDGVPETIAALREAGMKVWVLTGDKQETAISIGFSCNLLMHDMELITVNATTPIGCRDAFRKAFETINRRKASSLTINEESMPSTPLSNTASLASLLLEDGDRSREIVGSRSKARQPLALIIDGNSLVHALKKEFEQELFDIATACQVVICCRVAPSQKANIVSLVKEKAQDMTLAIGDGANDVPMLQKAHVGVGISGQEGRQAVMSSDFSMGQFKFLRKLLLVHGHWNYQRLSYMVLYNFYRNAVFVMMLFWYILQTAFSASSAVFDWNLMFYSLIYTSIPTVVVGILDKDIDQDALLNYPPLYGAGQRDENYNNLLFWITMLDTLWQSLVLFYVPFFTFQVSTIDVYSLGSLWTIAVVVLVSLHLAMDIHQWTWITHVAIWGSILATFGCLFVLDSVTLESFLSHYGVIYKMIASINYWYDIALIVVFALLPRFCVKVVMQRKWPSDVQIIREAELNQA